MNNSPIVRSFVVVGRFATDSLDSTAVLLFYCHYSCSLSQFVLIRLVRSWLFFFGSKPYVGIMILRSLYS